MSFNRDQIDANERQSYQQQFGDRLGKINKGGGSAPNPGPDTGAGCLTGAGRLIATVVVIALIKVCFLGFRSDSDRKPYNPPIPHFNPIEIPKIEIPNIEVPPFPPPDNEGMERLRELLKEIEERDRREQDRPFPGHIPVQPPPIDQPEKQDD